MANENGGLFKGIDEFEREYVGYHEGDENEADGFVYCGYSIREAMVMHGLLEIEGK